MSEKIDPAVRVDKPYFHEVELFLASSLLDAAALFINAIAEGGEIYPNVKLAPQQAMAKAQLMQQPPQPPPPSADQVNPQGPPIQLQEPPAAQPPIQMMQGGQNAPT